MNALPSRRSLFIGLAAAVGTLAVAGAFLAWLDVKERDNRFCVSCHLHDAKFARMTGGVVSDLAGFHYAKDVGVGCIACHGGADLAMRTRVWSVAAYDTLRFLIGAYREPTHMRLPLRDVDCWRCHTPISKEAAQAGPGPTMGAATGAEAAYMAEAPSERVGQISFHAFRDHDAVDVRCVACHAAHTTDSTAAEHFLSRPVIEPICRECHRQP